MAADADRSAVRVCNAIVRTIDLPSTEHAVAGQTVFVTKSVGKSSQTTMEETNRWMLRARDAMDRDFAGPLDITSLAAIACVSEAHFIRSFKATFGETPHRYLQRRRIERAMFLLRTTNRSVTEVCMDVGFTSLGSFSRIFTDIVGMTPSTFREQGPVGLTRAVPSCFVKTWSRPSGVSRPSSFGEAI